MADIMMSDGTVIRQVSVERLLADNRERLGLVWQGGQQGGSRVLTGDSALKPTVGQVGHMNFIHPFRIQILGAAEAAYLLGLPQAQRSRGQASLAAPQSPRETGRGSDMPSTTEQGNRLSAAPVRRNHQRISQSDLPKGQREKPDRACGLVFDSGA